MKKYLALAVVAVAMSSACPMLFADTTDSSSASSNQPVTDTWITTKVKADLATTDGIKSGDITVTTKNGLVTLSGNVASKAQVQKATAIAKSVKGVHDVDASALNSRD